jgi:hypothetical protein
MNKTPVNYSHKFIRIKVSYFLQGSQFISEDHGVYEAQNLESETDYHSPEHHKGTGEDSIVYIYNPVIKAMTRTNE